jgi:hypothetical protein
MNNFYHPISARETLIQNHWQLTGTTTVESLRKRLQKLWYPTKGKTISLDSNKSLIAISSTHPKSTSVTRRSHSSLSNPFYKRKMLSMISPTENTSKDKTKMPSKESISTSHLINTSMGLTYLLYQVLATQQSSH